MSDPIDEIQTQIQHARERDQTNTQQVLDRISEGLRILKESEDPPRADRIAPIVDELNRLNNSIDDPEESARIEEARDRLRDLIDDSERVDAFEEHGRESDE